MESLNGLLGPPDRQLSGPLALTASPILLAQAARARENQAAYTPQPSSFQGLLNQPLSMDGRFNILPLMDTPQGRQFAMPGILAGLVNAFTAPGRAMRGDPVGDEEGMNFALGLLGGGGFGAAPKGALAANAWHGSPHKFEKFDAAKIGTGEGAQAYGHGIYFAENKGVADSYKRSLSDTGVFVDGKLIKPTNEHEQIALKYLQNAVDSQSNNPFSHARQTFRAVEGAVPGTSKYSGVNAALDRWQGSGAKLENTGSLYKVDIPDSAINKMLDWDKPLSQQPESVKNVLRDSGWVRDVEKINTRAGEYFKTSGGIDAAASQELRKMGIPGIRYLDQGSRGEGQGTYNYVIFPGMESQVKILERK